MSKTVDTNEQDSAPVPDRDYYLENGYMVFTEYYLLKRGRCCGSGCRHCPYRKKKQQE